MEIELMDLFVQYEYLRV